MMNRNSQSYFKLGGIRPSRPKSRTPIIVMGAICLFSITYAVFLIFLAILHSNASKNNISYYPMVITTWEFVKSTEKAWEKVYVEKNSALDAVEEGCKVCQELQCDGTVGYGGSPDENGESTLEALIMDGATMNVGAVASLRRVKNVIGVARHVLDYTQHSILAGDLASEFALKMKFKQESLSTNTSTSLWKEWKENKCQPNFWTNVSPDPMTSCGPYIPKQRWGHADNEENRKFHIFGRHNHDTIGIIVIDSDKNIAAGTSTNGAKYKIPGRVGDSPIPGAGAYADNDVGAAACTGDGDIMLRFLPSFLAVEELRRGSIPNDAAAVAINRIAEKYPSFVGGIVVVNNEGVYGAACNGMKYFPFTVSNTFLGQATVNTVNCIDTEL